MATIGFSTQQKKELRTEVRTEMHKELKVVLKPIYRTLLEHSERLTQIEGRLERIDLLPTKQDLLDLMDKCGESPASRSTRHLAERSALV